MRLFFNDSPDIDLCRMLNIIFQSGLRMPIIIHIQFGRTQIKITKNNVAIITTMRQITMLYSSAEPPFYRTDLYILTFFRF